MDSRGVRQWGETAEGWSDEEPKFADWILLQSQSKVSRYLVLQINKKKATTLFSLLCFPSNWQLQTYWKPVTRTSNSLDDGEVARCEQLVWSPEFTGKMDETQSHCEFPFWLLCFLQIVFGGFQMVGLLHGGDLCQIIMKATSEVKLSPSHF